ncbi:hypothetical protein SpCBS45565_g08244 [Spizellomyces sp. 'palustris']|nr:hypothetical protein SpCBS45565_g08244 [Spizellomyces sp. 'palustris']
MGKPLPVFSPTPRRRASRTADLLAVRSAPGALLGPARSLRLSLSRVESALQEATASTSSLALSDSVNDRPPVYEDSDADTDVETNIADAVRIESSQGRVRRRPVLDARAAAWLRGENLSDITVRPSGELDMEDNSAQDERALAVAIPLRVGLEDVTLTSGDDRANADDDTESPVGGQLEALADTFLAASNSLRANASAFRSAAPFAGRLVGASSSSGGGDLLRERLREVSASLGRVVQCCSLQCDVLSMIMSE